MPPLRILNCGFIWLSVALTSAARYWSARPITVPPVLDDALLDEALLDVALLVVALLVVAPLVVAVVDVVKSPVVLLVEEPTRSPVVLEPGAPPAPSPPLPAGRIGSMPVAQAAISRAAKPSGEAFIHRPDTLLIPMTSPPELASKR